MSLLCRVQQTFVNTPQPQPTLVSLLTYFNQGENILPYHFTQRKHCHCLYLALCYCGNTISSHINILDMKSQRYLRLMISGLCFASQNGILLRGLQNYLHQIDFGQMLSFTTEVSSCKDGIEMQALPQRSHSSSGGMQKNKKGFYDVLPT